MSERSTEGMEHTEEVAARQVNYLVELNSMILGPYRAHTAERALEQALDDAAPSEISEDVAVYESAVHTNFSVDTGTEQ